MTNNTVKTEELTALIKAFNNAQYLSDHTECIETALGYTDADNADDFMEWFMETYVHSAEIIYYGSAMEFLSENDPSLRESLGLAGDMGFTPENINSETLASILLQEYLRDELYSLESELEDYFTALDEVEA